MGVCQLSTNILSSLDLKGMVLENKGSMDQCSSNIGCSTWLSKAIQLQAMRRRFMNRRSQRITTKRNYGYYRNKRSKVLLMKRNAVPLEAAGRSTRPMNMLNGVEKKVRTLQKLLPNITHDDHVLNNSMDMDGLFKEAADYIISLEMQVKVMQIMVKVLSDSNA